jgi:glutaredoxin
MNPVTVYGADWCEDTRSTLHHLDSLGVHYEYINIEKDPHAKHWVKAHNAGKQKTPTVDIEGNVLSVPDERQLEQTLRGTGLMS